MKNLIKNPNGKLSDKIISERHPYYFVWDKELKIVTELWTTQTPTEFWLLEFETYSYSGLVHSWAPYVGASNKVLTLRKIWLCGNCYEDVENLCNYVEKGYKPLGQMYIEQHLQKFEQVMHIKIIQ
jgi:hypothetical protein